MQEALIIPEVKYYFKPELQSLRDKICNEIQMHFDEEDGLLTPEEITENINARLGDNYTVDQVLKQVKAWGSNIITWNDYLVLLEMVSSATTEYRAHLSKSKKWSKKWK